MNKLIILLSILVSVNCFNYNNNLRFNNGWKPKTHEEQISYNAYINHVQFRKIPGFNYKRKVKNNKNIKKIEKEKKNESELCNIFKQEGEVSIME